MSAHIRWLGRRPYEGIEAEMRAFTEGRDESTPDEIWIVEHDSVFTQGIAGRDQHVLVPGDIPVVRTLRGGQVTYHGPGQVVAYPLIDLRRLGIYVKEYVFRLEAAIIQVLDSVGVTGLRVRTAPGVYVRLDDPFSHAAFEPQETNPLAGLGKIAALGVKVSQHRTFHGLALNVAMDLEPFTRIDPCGYAGLATVDLRSLGVHVDGDDMAQRLAERLQTLLSAD